MKILLPIVAVSLIVGCVPNPDSFTFDCDSALGVVKFHNPVSCYDVAQEALNVQKMLSVVGIEAVPANVNYVLDIEMWDSGGISVIGQEAWGTVILNKNRSAWVHEMLHVFLPGDTSAHHGWDSNGYFALGDIYTFWIEKQPMFIRGKLTSYQRERLLAAGYALPPGY